MAKAMDHVARETQIRESRPILKIVGPDDTKGELLREIQGLLGFVEKYGEDPFKLLSEVGKAYFLDGLAIIGEQARGLAGIK